MTDPIDVLLELSRWQREGERRAIARHAEQQLGEAWRDIPPGVNRLTKNCLLSQTNPV